MKPDQIPNRRLMQRRIVLLCWLAYALSYLCRTNLSIALPQMTAEFQWSTAAAGAVGSGFFVSYGVGHLISGILGDRLAVKKFMAVGLLGTSLCNLLMGVFPTYGVIFSVWLLNGLFLSTLWGPIVRVIAAWFSPEERNFPAVLVSLSSMAGYLISWACLGVVIQFTGWRGAFFLPGILTLLFSLWFCIRMEAEPQKLGLEDFSSSQAEKTESAPPAHISLWKLAKKEHLVCFCIAAAAQGIIKDGITLWEPTMLTGLHHASPAQVSAFSSLIPLCSLLGVVLSGKLMNRFCGREKKPALLLFAACGLCCAVFCFVMGRSLWLDAAFFSVISALLMGVNTLLLTFLPLRFSIYGRASGVAGLFNFCAYLGAGCSGVISGWLADLGGWNTTILLWLALCVLGLAGIWAGFRKKIPVSES